MYIVCLGTSPVIWKNLNKGNYTVSIVALCIDYQMKRFTVSKTFQFRIR